MDSSMISIAIPFYKMENHEFFMERLLNSIKEQTYRDYEIVITEEGRASENTNAAIKKCKGDIIKVMYMDDYFSHPNALKEIAEAFDGDWMIHGCNNNLVPVYTGDIHLGNNKLGSPSCLVIRKGCEVEFDTELKWLLDCDFYKRMHARYGLPQVLVGDFVTIGVHPNQATNLLSDLEKEHEVMLMRERYV